MPFSRFKQALGIALLSGAVIGARLSAALPPLGSESVSVAWLDSGEGARGMELRDGETQGRFALPESGVWVTLEGEGAEHFDFVEARPTEDGLTATAGDARKGLSVQWSAQLRPGTGYALVRLRVVDEGRSDLAVAELGLLDQSIPGGVRSGPASGGLIVADGLFLGIAHPLAQNLVVDGRARCAMPIHRTLHPGEAIEATAVVGFAAPGQLRRCVLAYLERERPRPYRPFLHYNSWYSIGYFNPYSEQDLGGIIRAFQVHLAEARGVALNGFVLDDGWDDPGSLWSFGPGFPDGLARVGALARESGAAMGIWLSPWGGYGKPKERRIALGTAEGFETREGSFSLSGPRYYARFESRCVDLLRKDHVAYFKFDGIGSKEGPERLDPAARRDFEAMDHLIGDLRAISPQVYVNETTGTWPSPFWLLNVDSIWRGGEDHDFAGAGDDRERWITYRDAQTYAHVVSKSPLFPLNSLMLHGIIFADKAKHLNSADSSDFENEVWSYFGTGTQLQELYLSPGLLSERNWDDLADAERWAASNRKVLEDTHWIGGDPARLEVYGWAAWTPGKGTIVLRNPNAVPAVFALDLASALELPAGAPRGFSVSTVHPKRAWPDRILRAGNATSVALDPFEVLVLEAVPESR